MSVFYAEIPTSTIIMIASVVVATLALITADFLIMRHFDPYAKDSFQVPPTYVKGTPSYHDKMEQGCGKTAAKKIDSSHKLTFFRNDTEKFDLADLLKTGMKKNMFGNNPVSFPTPAISSEPLLTKDASSVNGSSSSKPSNIDIVEIDVPNSANNSRSPIFGVGFFSDNGNSVLQNCTTMV